MSLTQHTREHMADVLAPTGRRIEPDVWSGPAKMLGVVLPYAVCVLLLAAMAVYHYDLEPW